MGRDVGAAGILNPLIDRRMERDAKIQAAARDLDSRAGEERHHRLTGFDATAWRDSEVLPMPFHRPPQEEKGGGSQFP